MLKKLVFYCSCFFLLACPSEDDGIACTLEFVYGLSITVLDAVTGQPITENITVTATEGDYSEALVIFSDSTVFVGAGEREGIYRIHILAEGYETFTSGEIVVGANECHVLPEARTFELQPL